MSLLNWSILAGLDRSSNGFHRMLYVFCCRQSVCYTENKQAVTVLRSQLAADNPFYGLQPVPEGWFSLLSFTLNLFTLNDHGIAKRASHSHCYFRGLKLFSPVIGGRGLSI